MSQMKKIERIFRELNWKKSLFLVLFIAISVSVMAEKASVEKWSVYNIELKGPSTGNPFTDSKLSA